MNESSPPPSGIPPLLPDPVSRVALNPHVEDLRPIAGWAATVEAILRQPGRVTHQLKQPDAHRLITALLAIAVGCCLIYGLVVGTFSGGNQLWAAPIKIAAGLVISALICLPSLYIFSCLSGSDGRLVEVWGLVA